MKLSAEQRAAWPQVSRYFDRALDLDPPARSTWLQELASTEPQLAAAVRTMLEEHAALNSEGFLQEPLLANAERVASELRDIIETSDVIQDTDPTGLEPGATMGPYRLLRKIGSGGMSSVWLAESTGPVKREVALKLPSHGAGMRRGRFERERDLLAALTHPNIARLYDAGTTATGQPYLAMEYVPGTALLESCDGQQLTIRERLQLFQQVLEAVQFAHSQLIIHRDLKPSNIIAAPGRVVLLDFGIGKLVTTDDDATLTQMGARAFTPRYASPEQIAGQPLGTASDIYSLGVILYELLTGTSPYRPTRDSRAALEEAILTEEIVRPSQSPATDATAAQRRSTPSALAGLLRGDLDTIVLKALKKDPLQRYASVTAFAQDIANYLVGLPVSARPDSRWYRTRRFVSRHKIPVVAAAVTLTAILSGAGLALWQGRAAALERDRAIALNERNEAINEFLGRIIKDAAESQTPVTVSEMLARSEKLALQDTSELPENRAAVLEIIADRYWNLGDPDRPQELMKTAIALLDHSPDRSMRTRFACRRAAMMADLATSAAAERSIEHEISANADPQAQARCLLDLSFIAAHQEHSADTLRHAQRGLDLLHSAERRSSLLEAQLLDVLAYGYHLSGNRFAADQTYEQVLRKFRDIGRNRSDEALLAMNNWALAIARTQPQRALDLYQQVSRIMSAREFGAERDATTVANEGLVLQLLGRYQQAEADYAYECHSGELTGYKHRKVHCRNGLAEIMLETGQAERAATYLAEAAPMIDFSARPATKTALIHGTLMGRLALQRGQLAEANAHFDWVLAQGVESSRRMLALLGKAEVEIAASRPSAALALASEALDLSITSQGGFQYSQETGYSWLIVGLASQHHGERDNARAAFESAVTQLSHTVDPDHPRLLLARRLLGGS